MTLLIHEPGRGYYTPVSPTYLERKVNPLEELDEARKTESILQSAIYLSGSNEQARKQKYGRTLITDAGEISDIPVAEIMSRNIITIKAESPLEEAWALCETHNVHHLVVSTEQRVIGILAFDAILSSLFSTSIATVQELKQQRTEVCISRFMYSATPSSPASMAARLMLAQNIDALAVIDQNRLAGIVTSHDILKKVATGYHLQVQA